MISSHVNKDIIGSATSVQDIITPLATRGCRDVTSLVDPASCSDYPCAGGGFCDVYQGALKDGTTIAIKSLRVYGGDQADGAKGKILKHAARELYHWAKLQHRNVLPLFGLILFRNRISMVSEWMNNGTLSNFLEHNPEVNRTHLCMDVCAGLCYIHAQGMVHGDLKAANVMVSTKGVAMIADFGNARLKDLTLKFSNSTEHSISLRWTAPELLVQDCGAQASKEADVYAYGMTVLEVMTGKIPYEGVDERRVLGVITREQRHPSRPENDLDDNLWEVMKGCWSRRPEERPNINTVADRLRSLYFGSENPFPDAGPPTDRAAELTKLGMIYSSRFEHVGMLEDLNKAIEYQTEAVLLTPEVHQNKASRLSSLGISCTRRFERLGELVDLGKAIENQTRAVALTPDGHTSRPARLSNLGGSFLRRFEYLGELEDLRKAIIHQSHAALLTSDDDVKKPGRLINLGSSYLRCFECLRKPADVDEAIECQTLAVRLTPNGHTDKPSRLNSLGISYTRRFECLGRVEDLEKAIEYQTKAVALTSSGNTNQPSRISNLGGSYLRRFERLGTLEDLHTAIIHQAQAVMLTSDSDAKKPGRLINLGGSYLRRFESLGELVDVNRAIELYTQVALLTPDTHMNKPGVLNCLGQSYIHRFRRFDELADVHEAIKYHTQAVHLTPDSQPDKSRLLNDLGSSHQLRFERLGKFSDLNKAIECQTQAMELTPGH